MASTLVRLPASGRVMKGAQVHHIPAKICVDGPAPVSTYFLPAAVERASKPAASADSTGASPASSSSSDAVKVDGAEKTAFLRGRALDGVVARLPDGMVGVVVSEAHFADLSSSRAAAEDSDSSDDESQDGAAAGGINDDGPWDAALQVDATFGSLTVW